MNRENNILKFLKVLIPVYIIIAILLMIFSRLILDFSLNVFLISVIFIICSLAFGIFKKDKRFIIASAAVFLLYAVSALYFSPILSYKAHRNLIGNIEEIDFSSEIEYIDLNQLPTIDKDLASKLADKKLGEIPSLGSQVTVGELTLQSINGELYYVAPLEHSSLLKWFTNKSGTKGYIKVSATNQNDVQLVTNLNGQDLHIKYLDSSYLLSDLKRAAYFRDMKAGHTDFTFELDDTGRPYWVITRFDNAIGIEESKAIGVLVMDAQTGESNTYSIDDAPKWIDRIQPMTYTNRYLNKWGKLVHGLLNFTDKDKLETTDGMTMIYNKEKCYYYTGITSVGNDESLVGFTLTDTRTGQTMMYKTSGATENAGMKSAEGKVQQYAYKATFPYLINIQNEPTYFMTLKDSSGLVKQYAMVNVKNYNTIGVGDNVQSALNKYLEALTDTNISLKGGNNQQEVKGEVERVGLVLKDGNSVYDIKLKNDDNIYSVSTETAREAALTKVGDNVQIKYINVGDSRYIIVNSFINSSAGNEENQAQEQKENEEKQMQQENDN